MNEPMLNEDQILILMREGFPGWDETGVVIESVAMKACRLRLAIDARFLRHGGTVSGPTQFFLADTALFIATLASVGPKSLAVTTNVSINFLRKPAPRDLTADCRLLKLGSRLAVGEVLIFSDGEEDPVAHATGTYSIPAR